MSPTPTIEIGSSGQDPSASTSDHPTSSYPDELAAPDPALSTALPGDEHASRHPIEPGSCKLHTVDELEEVFADVVEDLLGSFSPGKKQGGEGHGCDEGCRGRSRERAARGAYSRSASKAGTQRTSRSRARHGSAPSAHRSPQPPTAPSDSSDSSDTTAAPRRSVTPDSNAAHAGTSTRSDGNGDGDDTEDTEAQVDVQEDSSSETESLAGRRRRRRRIIELLIVAFTRNVGPKLVGFLGAICLYLVNRYVGVIPGSMPAPVPPPELLPASRA